MTPFHQWDDNYAIEVAIHLAQLLTKAKNPLKTVISTHHGLFFNVLHNVMRNEMKFKAFFMSRAENQSGFKLKKMSDTPNFQHIAILHELVRASESGQIYTYHFNMLRNVLEKTASFHGYKRFSDCIQQGGNSPDSTIFSRLVNLLSHGNYSLFDPVEMSEGNKQYFREILSSLIQNFGYNTESLSAEESQD